MTNQNEASIDHLFPSIHFIALHVLKNIFEIPFFYLSLDLLV